MKLTSIEAMAAYPPGGPGESIPIVEIQADNGLTGWGEAQASRAPDAVCDIVGELLSPVLRNQNFDGGRGEIEALWDRMYGLMRNDGQTAGFALEAIGAVDMALWDLAGKARDKVVCRMAGNGSGVAETQTFVALDPASGENVWRVAERLRESGFNVFELLHNRGEGDLLAALDLAAQAAPGARLAVNAQWRIDAAADYSFQRQIDRRALLWLANPLPPEDPFSHGRLSRAMCTPLALGESYFTHYQVAPFFHEEAIGVLQLDLGRCGLTEAFRMAELAKSHNVPVVVRVGESLGPQLAAAIQFAAADGGRRVEYSPARLKTANSVLRKPIELKEGKYRVPQSPGLGIQIDEAEIHLLETQAA